MLHSHGEIPDDITQAVNACAKGSYQKDLLSGRETWSGSSMKGNARRWSIKYEKSKRVLLQRINVSICRYNWRAEDVLVRYCYDGQVGFRRNLTLFDLDNNEYEW